MRETFWSILDRHKIEIPEIQRDYAQGRKNKKVKSIRNDFVKDLLNTITNNKDLNLDFIFGYSIDEKKQAELENNKSNLRLIFSVLEQYGLKNDLKLESKISRIDKGQTNDKILIPIDGQQRLTTLFLLHLYIGAKAEVDLVTLKRFLYKTRESSTLFLEDLVENFYHILKECKDQNLSAIICDQEWFFKSWMKDPTVSGMLVMLDELHSQVSEIEDINFKDAWISLTEKKAVNFDFYDIDENDLGNDLYIKMNARGKPLNEFQNFKAWLQKNNSQKDFLVDDWMTKMDKSWLDIFWNKSKVISVEDNYLSFFENIGLLTESQYLNVKEISKKDIKLYFDTLGNNEFPPISFYEKNEIFCSNTLNFAFTVLERLSVSEELKNLDLIVQDIWTDTFYVSPDRQDEENLFSSALFVHFNDLNLFHKTFIYAVLRFIYKIDKPISDYNEGEVQNFKSWIRISRNLIYNSRIDNNTPFVIAIQAIFNLDDNILNINSFIENSSDENWIGFSREIQRLEEREKVIKLDPSWYNAISNAERHFYFYGQIQFILDISKSENGEYNLERFETNFNKLKHLFSRENLIDQSHKFRIQRLLLCTNDKNAQWMKGLSSNRWSFYSSAMTNSRQRDENWRILFNKKLTYLKNVLAIPDFESLDIENYLSECKNNIDDWRYFFIDNPKLIAVCKQRMINWSPDCHIRLLGSSRLSHYHYELRSYALYHESFKGLEGFNIKYKQVKRGKENPYILFRNDDVDYKIIFDRNDSYFKYRISDDDNQYQYKKIDNNLPRIADTILKFQTFCK